MTHRLQLGDLRQQGRRRAPQMRGNFGGLRDLRWKLRAGPSPRLAQFEYQRFSRLQFGHCPPPIVVLTYAATRDGFMTSVRAPVYESISACSLDSIAHTSSAWPNSG